MERCILKLQIWDTKDEITDEGEFRNFYFDVSKVSGWFIPTDNEEMEGEEAINILFEGDMITVKQEPHLIKYLSEKFVEPSKINI